MSKTKHTATIVIRGMHCPSCDILVAAKFKEIRSVIQVKPNFKTGLAEVTYKGRLPLEEMNAVLKPFGYSAVLQQEGAAQKDTQTFTEKLMDVGVIGMLLFITYFFAKELNLVPSLRLSSLDYTAAFLLGIVASLSTCMATRGSLFLSTIGQLKHTGTQTYERLIPAGMFVAGMVVMFGAAGLALGFVGNLFTVNTFLGSVLNTVVAVALIAIALDMLRFISIGQWFGNKQVFITLRDKFLNNSQKGAFLLGVVSFFLPCGFTMAVQTYALSLANPYASMLTMVAFALGTVPSFLILGYISSLKEAPWYSWFQKATAVVILAIGISYVGNTLALYNLLPSFTSSSAAEVDESLLPPIVNGKQVVNMSVTSSGYEPNSLVVRSGVPVLWKIEGLEVFGCQSALRAPITGKDIINVREGEQEIEFTPVSKGTFAFSCSMGMFRGQFRVI